MIPQNLFPARKKAPQKKGRPVPVYMEITPPGIELHPWLQDRVPTQSIEAENEDETNTSPWQLFSRVWQLHARGNLHETKLHSKM